MAWLLERATTHATQRRHQASTTTQKDDDGDDGDDDDVCARACCFPWGAVVRIGCIGELKDIREAAAGKT